MSRCMPFPSPGYLWNDIGGKPLLQVLKLRRDWVESENKRKERRRKRKKRRHGQHEDEGVTKKRYDHDNQIGREQEKPRLENSTLTEELGQIIPDNVYDCSDVRIRDEIKRKKPHSSDQGFLLQSSYQVHKDAEAVSIKSSCSSELPMDVFDVQDKFDLGHTSGNERSYYASPQGTVSKCDTDLGGSPQGKSDYVPNENFETSYTFSESGVLETESKYIDLIVNQVPPPLQMFQADSDDQEWLSKGNLSRSGRTHNKHVSNGFCQGSYPYAHYLPDADIYVLPFTIPF